MSWKDRPLYSRIIAISVVSLIVLNILLAIILPVILSPETEQLVISMRFIQNDVLLPITYIAIIAALVDMWTRKKSK